MNAPGTLMSPAPQTPNITRYHPWDDADVRGLLIYFRNTARRARNPQKNPPAMLTKTQGKMTMSEGPGYRTQLTMELDSKATNAPHKGPSNRAESDVPIMSR